MITLSHVTTRPEEPSQRGDAALVQVEGLNKYFRVKGNDWLHTVDDVSFSIRRGTTLRLVGCGETTVGRVLVRLIPATAGRVLFEGKDILKAGPHEVREIRGRIQMIFQDPCLNPRKTVRQIVSENH